MKFKRGFVYFRNKGFFFHQVALGMVVLSSLEDEDDLCFFPKLK